MKNIEVEEISKVAESSEHEILNIMPVDEKDESEYITKTSAEIFGDSASSESAEKDACIKVSDSVNDDSSSVQIYESSVNEAAVSEEIIKLTSDICDKVQNIVNNDANDLVSDSNHMLNESTAYSEENPETFETTNGDLYCAEMGDDNNIENNVPTLDHGKLLIDEELNEEDETCTNSFLANDINDSFKKERHWKEQGSLPYYREPKPDFFEYVRKLQEKLEPKPSVNSPSSVPNSSTCMTELGELVEPSNQTSDLFKVSTTPGTYRNKKSTAYDLCFDESNRKSSRKPVSGLIILDDYKSPRIANSHFSRSCDTWSLSPLNSIKEKPEPVPGAKYKELKQQLMEKIMLKKEESLNKRKVQQEIDEENFEEEEEIASDGTPCESENGLSDDEMEDDSPENAEDDVVLKEMLVKECQNFPGNVSEKAEDSIHIKNSETEDLDPAAVSEDSQEPMECYSLPSYQPGGGFSNSPLQKRSMKRIFSDSDFNDSSALTSPLKQKSLGRIFSDSDFNDSIPSRSSEPSQLQNVSSSEFNDRNNEPLEGTDEQEIIPHWESLPVSQRQGSQLFDEDISVICSGKFLSTNEDIPWTPSCAKDSLPDKESVASSSFYNEKNNEPDPLDESDDEELVRPAKKIKLSLVEKLWDSEDEDDDSKDSAVQNGELKTKHSEIQSGSNVCSEQDNLSDVDADSEEDDDKSVISQKHVNDSFKESPIKDADEEAASKFEIKNFFENEAELSGEEGSADENEEDDDEYMEDEMITDEIVASEEKLRKEVGTIHFKRQQDEDDKLIRQLKEDFLPEGELYNENGQRKRRYIWNNIGADENDFTETKSESEEEEVESLPTDYLKWKQEKNKSDLPEEDVEVQTPKSIGLKVDIIGKVSVTRCSSVSNSSISASPMLRRGSFLNSSIAKNMKFIKEFNNSEGSVSRKNFVFSAPSPQPNASLPSTPAPEVKRTRISNIIGNRSIFNKI